MGLERIGHFGGPKSITTDEADILYNIVKKYRPKKVVEIGTEAGFATLYIAEALKDLNQETERLYLGSSVYSFDVYREDPIEPEAIITMRAYGLEDITKFIVSQDFNGLIDDLNMCVKDADLVFVDGFHDQVDKIAKNVLSNLKEGAVIVMHDVECEPAPLMKNPDVFKKLDGKKSIITTNDDAGNNNSFGISILDKVESKPQAEKEEPKTTPVKKTKLRSRAKKSASSK